MTTKSKVQEKSKLSDVDENILKLFDIKKRLGKGAYGIVWKATDRRTNETLAVKKIFDAFRDETDAQRTFREICFLQSFRSHPNVVKMLNVYKASNNLDIYLVFEYMESDLHNIIKKGSILKDIHKRFVMYQLVNAIRYIHSGNVIHRDLKPSNVLIDSKCRCKLADFGLARSLSCRPARDAKDAGQFGGGMPPLLTDYVATRWYRAPEILVASKHYTKGIDMWSLGCILAEMIRGKPLFQGTSTINQIEKIISALPDITEHDINAVGAGFGSVLLSKQASSEKKTTLEELIPDSPNDALDMVKSLLVLDPLGRLNGDEALKHPYVERFRHSVTEVELDKDIMPPFRDDVRLTVSEYRSKLYEIAQASIERSHNNASQSNNSNNNHRSSSQHASKRYANTVKRSVPPAQPAKPRETKYLERTVHKNPEIYRKMAKLSINNVLNGVHSTSVIEDSLQFNKNHTHVRRQSKQSQSLTSPTQKYKLMETNKTPNRNRAIADQQNLAAQHDHQALEKKFHQINGHTNKAQGKPDPYVVDKRHSIDGGYGSLTAETGSSQKTPTISQTNSNAKICKSSSITRLSNDCLTYVPPHMPDKTRPPTPKVMRNEKYRNLQRSSSEIMGKSHRQSKESIGIPTRVTVTQKDATEMATSFCYDARIKKIEAEIAGFKDDIKKFAKETKYYSRPPTPTRSTPTILNHQHQQPPTKYPQVRSKYTGGTVGVAPTISASRISATMQHIVPAEGAIIAASTTAKRNSLAFPTMPREKADISIFSNTGGSGDHIGRNFNPNIETTKSSNHIYKYSSSKHRHHMPQHQQSRARPSSKVI